MARITHPQPQVGVIIDQLGGIEFTDGVAEVDLTDKPNLREAYLQHGYAITEPLNVVDLTGGAPFQPTVTVVRAGQETTVTPDANGVFEVWLDAGGDGTVPPLPLPDAVEGETTERVYEEFTLPVAKRARKAKP